MINVPIESKFTKEQLEAAEKLKPSSDPSFWAKKGCKECCGRGIVGKMTTVFKGNNRMQSDLVCSCTRARYRAWLTKTIEDLEKQKGSDLTPENHSELDTFLHPDPDPGSTS